MGRPVASISNRRFAVALANLLTRSTGCPHNAIARSGKCSIFSLLRVIRPSIVRDSDTGPRDGISEVEFNKALQVFCSTGFEVIEFKNLEFKNLEFMKIVYSLQMQFAINKRCQQRFQSIYLISSRNQKSNIILICRPQATCVIVIDHAESPVVSMTPSARESICSGHSPSMRYTSIFSLKECILRIENQ